MGMEVVEEGMKAEIEWIDDGSMIQNILVSRLMEYRCIYCSAVLSVLFVGKIFVII